MNNPETMATIFENISKAEAVSPTTLNGLPAMSSLEIAEITGKRHDHVLRDIGKMVTALEFRSPNLGSQIIKTKYRDIRGKFQPMAIIDKELTFTLLSRYSFELSNMIVKRWLELEGKGFERVSLQASVIHLKECDRGIRSAALRGINRGRNKRPQSSEMKEKQKWLRQAKGYEKLNGVL